MSRSDLRKSTRASKAKRNVRTGRFGIERLEDRWLMTAAQLIEALHAHDHHQHDHGSHEHAADAELAFEPAFTFEPLAAPAAIGASLALSPLSAIPVLNSLPGAPATLYIDFNGHFEASWSSYGSVTTPVFDNDGDATTFSAAELAFVETVWKVVAEDYAPFNINVTTVEPAVLAPGVAESLANKKAIRIAVGGDGAWTGSNPGGIAQYDSFSNSLPNLGFVFAGGSTSPVNVGSAASHEAGHTFGLRHQTENYSPGFSWGAVMGPYANLGAINTWHNGLTDLGSQDDIAMIARSVNGFGFRPDDHAATIAAATPLAGSGSSFSGSGVISSASDVDVFSLTTASAQNLLISVAGDATAQNLDAVIELRDPAGVLLVSSNPGDSLDASVIGDVNGTYYVAVRSNGEYGRLGQYTVTVSESVPGVRFSTSGAPYTTSESGRSETVTLALDARPTADVVFDLSSSDVGEGVLSTQRIVFTAANWFVPQTVTISGVRDGITDGSAAYTVTIAPAVSDDPAYNGYDPEDLNFVNLDDAAGSLFWLESFGVTDAGLVRRSSLAGDNAQTIVDMKAAYGTPALSFLPSRVAIDVIGGKVYWTDLSADVIRRANLDGTQPQTIVTGVSNAAGLAIDSASGKIYWSDSTLKKIQRANLDGSGVEDVITSGLVTPGELEIDAASGKLYWADSGNYSITRANVDGSGVEKVFQADSANRPNGLELDLASGHAYFSVRSNSLTSQLHRVDLTGGNHTLLVELPAGANVSGLAMDQVGGRLYWTDASARRIYSVDSDGLNLALVADVPLSVAGLAVLPATPGVVVSPTGTRTTSEAGTTATFTVALTTPPTADVTIPLATSDVSEGLLSLASLTFTPANWSVPQTVIVTGRNDSFADGDKAYSIVLGSAVSADPAYTGLDTSDVSIVNLDDELQTVTVANTTSATIPDRGTITSTINLSTPGTLLDIDVRVNISHGWNEDLDVTLIAPDGTRVELFTDVGGMSSNFTNTVLDDEAAQAITAGAAPFTGRYRPEGNLTALEGKTAAGAWRLEIKDDARLIAGALIDWAITARTASGSPNPAAIVTPTAGLATSEGGGTASFTVRLNAQPAANVTIPVSTSDASEGVPFVNSITFTPANWNVPQTVVVTGMDDTIVDGAGAYTIVLGSPASADPDFAGLNPADVSVSNGDNDVPTTKFYVVDDGSANRTYEYAATGSTIENYTIASTNSAPRGIASTAAGDRVWVVDANRNVYVYSTSGALLGSWTAGTLASNALPEDITVHGSDVWIVDRQSDRVYRYAEAVTRLSGSQSAVSSFALNSSNGSAKGLVTDGASIWVVDDSSTNRVFKYTTSGSLLGSWTIASANSTPTGITIDPTNVSDIWIVDSGTDRVYQYSAAAGRTSGSATAVASFALATGNINPQGIADPPASLTSIAGANRNTRSWTPRDLMTIIEHSVGAKYHAVKIPRTRDSFTAHAATAMPRPRSQAEGHFFNFRDAGPPALDGNLISTNHSLEDWSGLSDEVLADWN